MRSILLSAVLVLISSILLIAQPQLTIIGGDTYDWKNVTPKDDPLKAKIKITNTGTEKLIISEVKPGCGCTTAPLDKSELNPGDTATLDVTLRIGGSQNQVIKSIRINSNDPKASQKFLYLKANVIHPLQLSQPYFTFNHLQVGQEDVSTIRLKNNAEFDVALSDYELNPKNMFFNLQSPIILKPGQEIDLIAKVRPDKTGNFNCTIKMKTTHPDYPTFIINGYGNVKESPIFNDK